MMRQSATICAAMLGLAHAANAWGQCEQRVFETERDVNVIAVNADRAVVVGPQFASVFRLDAGEWIFESDLPEPARFGASVDFGENAAIDGVNVFVAAPNDDGGVITVYRFDGANWEQTQILRDDEVTDLGFFGDAMVIEGDTAVVAAPSDDHIENNAGAVRILHFDGELWVLGQRFLPEEEDGVFLFGRAVDLQGDTMIVTDTISVHVFAFDGVDWVLQQRLTPDEPLDLFGYQASLHGDWFFVSEPEDDNANGVEAGAVHVYRFDGEQWIEHQKLIANAGEPGDSFGASISVMGDHLLIGAPSWGLPTGRTDLFELDGDIWAPAQQFTPMLSFQDGDDFGNAVALSDEGFLVSRQDEFYHWAFNGIDCNDNGVCDGRDIELGLALDCNDNGIPDECDIANGVAIDCNDDGLIDACGELVIFSDTSPQLSPIGFGSPQFYEIEKPLVAIAGVATVRVEAAADLNSGGEFIEVFLNGQSLGDRFTDGATWCPDSPDVEEIPVFPIEFIDIVRDTANIGMIASENVGSFECQRESYVRVTLEYPTIMPLTDCNGNGLPDSCDIANGDAKDANGNGIPDECDVLGDIDGDGIVVGGDLILLLGAWGPCDDCAACPADLDGDCTVGTADLILLLGNWT